jgi:DNA-damage-inducible protein D
VKTAGTFDRSAFKDSLKRTFENDGHFIDRRFWYASALMAILGYPTLIPLRKAIDKAIATLNALGVPVRENFAPESRVVNEAHIDDYRLSQFACYLITIYDDPRRPQTTAAQAYFADKSSPHGNCQDADDIERLLVRVQVSDHERVMSGMVKEAGAFDYRLFHNAGSRGMYNMDLRRLKEIKRIDADRSLLDFMTKLELTANLSRIIQTKAAIRDGVVRGQKNLEDTAERIGRRVRTGMIEITGSRPEELPAATDLRLIRTNLKHIMRIFDRLDSCPSNEVFPPESRDLLVMPTWVSDDERRAS